MGRLNSLIDDVLPLVARIEKKGIQQLLLQQLANATDLGFRSLESSLKEANEEQDRKTSAALARVVEEQKRIAEEEYRQKVAALQPKIDELYRPGVLFRIHRRAATIHKFTGKKRTCEP
jgi:hypothetical protein